MSETAPKFDARLEEGVKYLEEMLKLMPDDRTTLEFLVVAYEQLKEVEKSRKAVVMLCNLLLKQGDYAAAEGLLPRLEAIDTDEAKILVLKVRRLAAPRPELTPEAPKTLTPAELAAEEVREAVAAEVALVELLKSNGAIPDGEDATRLCDQLAATPANGGVFLVSALSILEKENFELCERCVAFLADRFGMPPVSVAMFDCKPDLLGKFPAELLRVHGAVPFAAIGDVALVALLNPVDEHSRKRLSECMKCRFFMTMPSVAEAWLDAAFKEGSGA